LDLCDDFSSAVSPPAISPSSSSLEGGEGINAYFVCSMAAFAAASFARRSGSKLLPSTKLSEMPKAARS